VGQAKDQEKSQRQKLGMMRQMLKNAEMIPGWEDKAEVIREEIKEQLALSNLECGVSKEQQAAIFLQQLQWKEKEKKKFKEAMIYHQNKAETNTKEYQKRKMDIKTLYAELEILGWNQVISDDDGEGSVDSRDAAAYMAANASMVRRADRARETAEETRERRARFRRGPVPVVEISDDEEMGAPHMGLRAGLPVPAQEAQGAEPAPNQGAPGLIQQELAQEV
jgi:hypothetical protein